MPHLAQVRAHHTPGRPVIQLDVMNSLVLLSGIEDGQRRFPAQTDMFPRDPHRIDKDAVYALLLQVADILQLLADRKLAHQQNTLITGRLQHPADTSQQLPDRDRIHPGQHDTDQLALFGFEASGKEIGLKSGLLDRPAYPFLLLQTDIAMIQIAGNRTF